MAVNALYPETQPEPAPEPSQHVSGLKALCNLMDATPITSLSN